MYLNFIESNFEPTMEELVLLKSNCTIDLYSFIQDQGGFIKVRVIFIKYFSQPFNIFQQQENSAILEIFQKYLLNYELQTLMINGKYLQRVYYIEREKIMNYFITSPEQWEQQQLIWTLPEDVFKNLNYKLFTLDDIGKNHGKQSVDIRAQNPRIDELSIAMENNYQAFSMKIKDYIQYVTDQQQFFSLHNEYTKDKVLSAVNINMENWLPELKRLFEHLPPSIAKFDGLKYLRQNCQGTNIPEMNIRSNGSWVGCQQECQGLNAVNINHGPGECQWQIIDSENVPLLYKLVPNLYKDEGLWYKNIYFFLEHQIPVKYVIQKPGDMILLSAGCFFLVKNIGLTINTQLNFIICNSNQLQFVCQRQIINDEQKIGSIVPIKNLMIDILIHQQIDILTTYVMKFIGQELETLLAKKQLIAKYRLEFNGKDVLQCTKCKREILILFQYIDDWVFNCVECVEGENVTIYMKYNINQLVTLINAESKVCSPAYCSNYVGKTKCTVQHLLEPLESHEEIAKQTINKPDTLENLIKDCNHQQFNVQNYQSTSNSNQDDDSALSEIKKLKAKIEQIKKQHLKSITKSKKKYSETQVMNYIKKTKAKIMKS